MKIFVTEKKFAAFIITFNRLDILPDTVEKIKAQSFPPQKIVIIDNGNSADIKQWTEQQGTGLEYYNVGYNAGPAGAAKVGLERLAAEGYEWIYWGDDNDPPLVNNCFEQAFKCLDEYPGNCGQIGAVGQRLNKRTGIIERVSTDEIRNSTYLEVDNIAGNMCKIIKGDLALKNILPEEKLFFGFEELDLDIKIKNAGYSIIADASLFLEYRTISGRLNYKRSYNSHIDESRLWREYYSVRNGLYIYSSNKLYFAVLSLITRKVAKSVKSYKHGFRYGNKSTSIFLKGFWHWCTNKYGKTL